MYWQKRFDRENPDKYLDEEISKIHTEERFIQTEVGRIRWVHIRLLLKKTKYFKVYLVKGIVTITL